MNLRITAFGQSPKLTLKERAERVFDLHYKLCDIVQVYQWKLYNSKTVVIDMQDQSSALTEIYKQVKKGLNTKVVKPIRYQENDIADITSNCWFYNLDSKGFNAQYSIGYPSDYFPSVIMTLENITDKTFFSKKIIVEISKLFIKEWQPYTLCVTDNKYFHDISKASQLHTPWTGWFTYLSNNLIQLPKNLKFKIDEIGEGKIVWTTEEYFSVDNDQHIQSALELENTFFKAGIKI